MNRPPAAPAPGPLSFRRATSLDVDAVVALVESAYRGEGSRAGWTTEADLLDGQRTDADAVRAAVGGPDTVVLLAEIEGALAGCCRLHTDGGGCAHLSMVAVRPDLQGRSLGAALLAHAERTATEAWGARSVGMEVIAQRDELIAWYARRGYARTGETAPFPYGDERFGIPKCDDLHFVVLAKVLEP